jgi:hypothetical protein
MATAKTDKAFLERLAREAPHLLDAEVDFEASVTRVVRADPGDVERRPRKRMRRTSAISTEAKPKAKRRK